jgi:hypothetical protein
LAIDAQTIDPVWEGAISRLERHLENLPANRCADVRLTLHFSGKVATFEATAADGLRGSRKFRDPDMLVPVAVGLLATVPVETIVEPEPDRHPSSFLEPVSAPDRGREGRDGGPAQSRLEIDFTAVGGARFSSSASTILPEVAGQAQVVVHEWFVLVGARFGMSAAVLEEHPALYSYSEGALSVGVGRRFSRGSSWFDIAVAPTVAGVSQDADLPDGSEGADGSAAQFRIAGMLSYVYRLSGPWGLVIAADADLTPSALAKTRRLRPSLPALPTWSSALHVGASGDLL